MLAEEDGGDDRVAYQRKRPGLCGSNAVFRVPPKESGLGRKRPNATIKLAATIAASTSQCAPDGSSQSGT